MTKIVKAIEWYLVVFSIELSMSMVTSEDNVLADYGTRLGTAGFEEEEFQQELSKLARTAQCFSEYTGTERAPTQPQYIPMLEAHKVVMKKFSIDTVTSPSAHELDESLTNNVHVPAARRFEVGHAAAQHDDFVE